MIFIGGIAQGRKDFDFFHKTMICKKCGRYSSISVFYGLYLFQFLLHPPFQVGQKILRRIQLLQYCLCHRSGNGTLYRTRRSCDPTGRRFSDHRDGQQ